MDSLNVGSAILGQPLSRSAMKNIVAGFIPHECNCICCTHGEGYMHEVPQLHLEGMSCDPGGGVDSHEECQDECQDSGFVTSYCSSVGGDYVCALCLSDEP